MLYHVSADATLTKLDLQSAPSREFGLSGPVVLAYDAERLPHYLLPEACPRVVLRSGPATSDADKKRFFADGFTQVIAIRMDWYERVRTAKLFSYQISPEGFQPVKGIAGYHFSLQPVVLGRPKSIANAIEAIVEAGYKLRCLPSLDRLCADVAGSTVQYSLIKIKS